jgi:NAD(P)-dependent dehydrogenase (short-subunit alcohol dehydrogenase family)
MITRPTSVLVVGATGSIGGLVVEESIRQGYPTRALVRNPDKSRRLRAEADIVVGDVTRPEMLPAAVAGIDAVVFTLGSGGAGKIGTQTVDYGGVRNVLIALSRPAGAHRPDDLDRHHQPQGRLQPRHPGARLEAPLGAARPGHWASVHNRAARMVRLEPA